MSFTKKPDKNSKSCTTAELADELLRQALRNEEFPEWVMPLRVAQSLMVPPWTIQLYFQLDYTNSDWILFALAYVMFESKLSRHISAMNRGAN